MPSDNDDDGGGTDLVEHRSHTFPNVLHHCTNMSTIIGVNRLISSPFKIQRLFWLVVVIVGTFFTVAHGYLMVSRYLSYDVLMEKLATITLLQKLGWVYSCGQRLWVQTTVSTEPSNEIDFPAVTVCNMNKMLYYNEHLCADKYMAMEKLVRFKIFYQNADFRHMIADILRQQNSSYLVPVVVRYIVSIGFKKHIF
jgi:hypothetical protein